MEHKDVLKLKALDTTDDIGHARRACASAYMLPVRTVRGSAGEVANHDGPWGLPVDELDLRLEVGYKTGSGNISSMLLDAFYIDREDMPLLTEYEVFTACGDCKGSSGGCPGFAPLFTKMKRNISSMFVFVVHYDYAWAHEYVTKKGWGKVPILRQMTYMDRLTDSYLNRLRKRMQEKIGCYVLGAGNCLGCLPSKCTVIKGLPCTYPKKRTFSMEATGIDCDELHHMVYGEYLPWYYQGTGKMPTYMSRYMTIFDVGLDYVELLRDVAINDWSYVDPKLVPEHDAPHKELLIVPSGVHEGYQQCVYS